MNHNESIYVAEVTVVNPITKEEETVEIYRDLESNSLFGVDASWVFPVAGLEDVSIYSPYNRDDVILLDPQHVNHGMS